MNRVIVGRKTRTNKSVEKFFDWKELSEVCEDEIPEHWSCLKLVGSSPSKA